MVDRYSYFCWTAQVSQNSQNSSTIIRIIDNWFRMVGYPQYIFSDSGPQFATAEFNAYCQKHYITPLVSSACYPTSNGLAESSVKIVKHLLLKSDSYMDFFLILWFYSCTHIILIMRLIVLNDSIGGHIHIFRDVCFFLNPPLPSYCCI